MKMCSRSGGGRTPQNQKTVLEQLHYQLKPNNEFFYEGDRLSCLLHSFHREIESQITSNKSLPQKLLLKQQFAVGINEVTRLLERMPASTDAAVAISLKRDYVPRFKIGPGPTSHRFCSRTLQAVLIASDCNPRWLTKHLLSLASSRSVPLIFVKDGKKGSIRLGELVKVKTAIAIGVKARGSNINQLVERVLQDVELDGSVCGKSVELATVS